MNDLRTAAQQALEALEGGADSWQLVGPAIDALKEALVEDAMQKFTDVSQEIEAALAEPPVDDPHRDHWVAIAEAAQKIAASTECGLAEAKALCAALDRLTDAALAEPVAWRYQDARGNYRYRGYVQGFDKEYSLLKPVPLYTAPPQRKPLTETSAERTLKRLGYTDCGGEFWKPPLGAPAEPVQEPTRSQQLAAAGFTRRDTRLECDECGGKFTRQMLPIHKCEPVQESVKLPTTATEAELMAKAGLMWLEQNAPDRLLKPVQEAEELKDPAEYDDFAAAIRHNERVTTRRYDSVGPVALETVYETIIHWDEGGGKRSRRELARRIVDLYSAPPQRKPLTDDQLDDIAVAARRGNLYDLRIAIEQAQGIT